MSILDATQPSNPNYAELAANNLKTSAKNTFLMMKNAFNAGSINFWNNPRATPQEIAEKLGTDAREIFQLHYALGQLINSIKPEAIELGLSKIGQFTINEDGSVSIIVTTTPEPTPEPTGE